MRFGVMGCLVAGKFADRDPLLDVPHPDAGQVAAFARYQVPPVLGPAPINQSNQPRIRQQ